MSGSNVGPGIVRRIACLWCSVPCAVVEYLENALGMATTNRGGVIGPRIEAGFTGCNPYGCCSIATKHPVNHTSYCVGLVGSVCHSSGGRCTRYGNAEPLTGKN